MIKDFNSVDFTAKVLGADRKTVYGAIARNEIPCVRIGRLIRVPGAWLRRAAGLTEPEKADSAGREVAVNEDARQEEGR